MVLPLTLEQNNEQVFMKSLSCTMYLHWRNGFDINVL